MGYTHYYSFKKTDKAEILEKKYKQACLECAKVLKYIYKEYNISLSGYSVHAKIGQYGWLKFNGKGTLAHEDFILREHFNQNEGFNFCKTAQKPYDLAVTACLAVLKYRLGNAIIVESDGDSIDFIEGTLAASTILKRKINNPIEK